MPRVRAGAGRSNRILTTEFIRKMVTTGGVGHYAIGFGSLEGGNGYVILATGGVANPVIFIELPTRIRAAYGWE